jgi:hypothetical protein
MNPNLIRPHTVGLFVGACSQKMSSQKNTQQCSWINVGNGDRRKTLDD